MRGLTSQSSPFTMNRVSAEICDFRVGQPSQKLIPKMLLDNAFIDTITRNSDPYIYQYPTASGPLCVRSKFASYLSAHPAYSESLDSSSMMLTYGNSHAIALILRTFTKHGDPVIVEDPTYFLVGKMLQDARVCVHPCPVDSRTGIEMDAFEELLIHTSPTLVYLNPIHHNPTGTSLSIEKQNRLRFLSLKHGFKILSDEPYVLLDWSEVPVCSMHTGDELSANVLACGTFSKLLAPGLRCGWIHASPDLISSLSADGVLDSGGGPPSLVVQTVADLVTSGAFEQNRIHTVKQLRRQCEQMTQCIDAAPTLRSRVTYFASTGGYFVYLQFEDSLFDVHAFHAFACKHFKVRFLVMSTGIRLSFAFYDTEEIALGIERLDHALEAYTSQRVA